VLRMNASEPMVKWKDEHLQSVGLLPPVIVYLVYLSGTVN
jgi:hypothetical protein